MKTLIVIAIALISLQGIAQQQGNNRNNNTFRGQKMNTLTAEEMAELQTKKMTINLDLNASQQKEVYTINLENATRRKTMMEANQVNKGNGTFVKPSKEERLNMMNAQLDNQIATKAKMKTILNKDQFEKWEVSQQRMKDNAIGMRKENRKGGNLKRQQ